MAKINIKSEKITSFGEIYYVRELFSRVLGPVIDKVLGIRCASYGYRYSEIVGSLSSVYFCGGDCIEDVTSHLMPHLSLHPTLRTCSSDTILRAISELATANTTYTSDTGKSYDFILAVEAYTGFMEFQPTTGSGHFDYYDNIHGHDALMSAGLIHLVPDFVNCQFRILHPQLVDRIILGTYKAGTKSQKFSGTALLNVPSGQPTYIMTRLYTVPKDYDFKKETGVDSTPWYNVIDGSSPYVWYYWPNNSNGIPYEFE